MAVNKEKVQKKIGSIRKRGDTVQKDIHETALECLAYASENEGDFTLLTELYHALPSMVRRASFKTWAMEFAPCLFVEKKGKGGAKHKLFKKDKKENAVAYDLAGAKDCPFWKVDPPKGDDEGNPLTVDQLKGKLIGYIKKLEKQAKESEADESVIDFTEKLLESLAA